MPNLAKACPVSILCTLQISVVSVLMVTGYCATIFLKKRDKSGLYLSQNFTANLNVVDPFADRSTVWWSDGSAVDTCNALDYQSRDRRFDPPLVKSFG